jgi:hypothetical protein
MAGRTRRHGGRASAGGRRRGRRRAGCRRVGGGGDSAEDEGYVSAQVPQKLGLGRGGRESGHTAPLGGVRTQLAAALGGGMRDVVVDEGELRTFVLELIVAGAAPLGRSGFASTFRSRAAA